MLLDKHKTVTNQDALKVQSIKFLNSDQITFYDL